MDAIERLKVLSSDMDLEPAEEMGPNGLRASHPLSASGCGTAPSKQTPFLSHAQLPNGKSITLLKSLLTSACERNCYYCPFRAGRDFRRETFKPDEMAQTFMNLHRAGIVEGIFLSSGIAGGGIRIQDQMIATGEILRHKYNYRGYLHLKLIPGAERDQVLRAMELADRVSVNLEAPNTGRLAKLAPRKSFMEELLQPMRWIHEIRQTISPHKTFKGRWPSMTTQFVVGAVGESDLELLSTTAYLHQEMGLGRAYFSAFRPVLDTPLENMPPESPARQMRLYQASFLLRDYGFSLEELPFEDPGNLPREKDPKLAWAQVHLSEQPVEINRADREMLLRVPGIGLKGVAAILKARRQSHLRALEDLRHLGINPTRAAPFIQMDGYRPVHQMRLF